jgi:hypothetical protein
MVGDTNFSCARLAKLWEDREMRAGRLPILSLKSLQMSQVIPPKGSKLTHSQASAIWENALYDQPNQPQTGWDQWAPDSALDYRFEAEVHRLLELHKDDARTLQLIRRRHGNNFSAVLPMAIERPLQVSEYYKNGAKRILNATHCRYDKRLSLFLQIHNNLQAFLLFKGCLEFRYPSYKLENHPQFGSQFQQLFHQALMALVNWNDPWDNDRATQKSQDRALVEDIMKTFGKSKSRDRSPARGKITYIIID